MRLTIIGANRSRAFDTGAAVEDGPAFACHRCGVCCERWQPLLTPADARRLAAHLGMDLAGFHHAYTSPYPFHDEQRLLRQDGGRCVFLRYDGEDGLRRAACTVHSARPDVCRDWAAGFDKQECLQGLMRFAQPNDVLPIEVLYRNADDQADFLAALEQRCAGSAGADPSRSIDAAT